MKRAIIILIVLIWGQLLLSVSVQMSDGLKYEGVLTSKLKGNIYLSDGYMLYELPIKKIDVIVSNGKNITEVTLKKDDFSKIDLNDNIYFIYTHGFTDSQKKDYTDSREVMLKMSDREFAIYELGQRQRQAEMVSRQIDGVSSTMWSIWGVSIGISVLTIIISNL